MYLLLCLALLGAASAVPLSEVRNTDAELSALYDLPQESFPTLYDISLFLDPDNTDYFYGNVTIRIIPNEETSLIVLHAMEMEINQIVLTSVANPDEDLFLSYTLATDDTQLLRITTSRPLIALQPHEISINYVGQFASNMFGVYISTYPGDSGTVSLITSQLQPTYARRVFPCYDEPAFKAVFRTTIYAPPSYNTVRYNMPLRTDQLKPEVTGWTKHEFQDTVVMSTYLHAYLVSNFDFISNDQNTIYDVPFRIYSRPGTQVDAAFALEFGQQNMIALENYTALPYALPKFDKAAVPDFTAGAMENWGLVLYREVALLVVEGVTTTATRQNIGRIICHENMHMWFGNEVSPTHWTYTWLNEGFANLFENFGTEMVLPEWRMMDQYNLLMQNVFHSDAVLAVNSMTHPVFTPSQVLSTFNSVAYQKSGSVIRMMQHFLTPEVFQNGLIIYLRDNSRRAVTPVNLYAALQQALDESDHSIPIQLATIMERWTTQGGFPVVTVRRSAPAANSFSVSQDRFLTDASLTSNDRWHIPINWVLSTNPDFSDTSPMAWVYPTEPGPAVTVQGLQDADWFIVNKRQTGYYRVNYDAENWVALGRALNEDHTVIHLLNRAQLVDDAFNLARNSRVDYNSALELSQYLLKEEDYIPWEAAIRAWQFLEIILSNTDAYNDYRNYALTLTAPAYERLGFTRSNTEEHVTAYFRTSVLGLNCRLGNEDCIQTAQDLLEAYRNNPTQGIHPDIQTTVYCSGLRGGDADNFNFLWQQYVDTDDSSIRTILQTSLGCTSNPELRDFYLNQILDDNSPVREQDKHSILVSVIGSGPENMEVALDFVVEHFDQIQPRVQPLSGTTNILNAFATRLTTQSQAAKVDLFESRYQSILTAGEAAAVAAMREHITASITWNNEHYATLASWLSTNYGDSTPDSAAAVTSGFLVLASVILAIYNH